MSSPEPPPDETDRLLADALAAVLPTTPPSLENKVRRLIRRRRQQRRAVLAVAAAAVVGVAGFALLDLRGRQAATPTFVAVQPVPPAPVAELTGLEVEALFAPPPLPNVCPGQKAEFAALAKIGARP